MLLFPDGATSEIIAQFNQVNDLPIPLTERDLFFGKGTKQDSGRFRLPAVAMYDSTYEGYVTVEYPRLNLTRAFGEHRPRLKAVGYNSLYQLLPLISEAVGFTITEDDVYDVKVTWLGGNEQVNILVAAKPTSLGFEGQFLIHFTRLRHSLGASVKAFQLDVIKHPWADPTKRCVDVLTWGIDFSLEAKHLVVRNSYWTYPAEVKRIMEAVGFANWGQPAGGDKRQLRLYKTSELPNANKDYEFVIVQGMVDGADYAGTAFIHYSN